MCLNSYETNAIKLTRKLTLALSWNSFRYPFLIRLKETFQEHIYSFEVDWVTLKNVALQYLLKY